MKRIAKLTAIAALAALTSTVSFAGPAYQPTPRNVKPRLLASPVAEMKCDTMVINGGGRNGMQVVSCKHYAKIRPTECRIACRNK
jgi:hypothetical protein